MMDGFGGMGIFGGFWMLLALLVGIALTALLLWAFIRLFPSPGNQPKRGSTPMDVLSRRYASGEISQAEYDQARKSLVEAAC